MNIQFIKEKLAAQFPAERFPDFHYEVSAAQISWEDGPCVKLISHLVQKWLDEIGDSEYPAYVHTFSDKEKERLRRGSFATVVENEFEKKAATEKQKKEEPNNCIWPVTYEEAAAKDDHMNPYYKSMIWEEIYGLQTGNGFNTFMKRRQEAKEKQAAFHVVDQDEQ